MEQQHNRSKSISTKKKPESQKPKHQQKHNRSRRKNKIEQTQPQDQKKQTECRDTCVRVSFVRALFPRDTNLEPNNQQDLFDSTRQQACTRNGDCVVTCRHSSSARAASLLSAVLSISAKCRRIHGTSRAPAVQSD